MKTNPISSRAAIIINKSNGREKRREPESVSKLLYNCSIDLNVILLIFFMTMITLSSSSELSESGTEPNKSTTESKDEESTKPNGLADEVNGLEKKPNGLGKSKTDLEMKREEEDQREIHSTIKHGGSEAKYGGKIEEKDGEERRKEKDGGKRMKERDEAKERRWKEGDEMKDYAKGLMSDEEDRNYDDELKEEWNENNLERWNDEGERSDEEEDNEEKSSYSFLIKTRLEDEAENDIVFFDEYSTFEPNHRRKGIKSKYHPIKNKRTFMTELLLKSVEAIDHELKKYFGMSDEEFEYFVTKFREDYFKGEENDQNNDLKEKSIKIEGEESNNELNDILSNENETEENDIEYDSELETESVEEIFNEGNVTSGQNDEDEDDEEDGDDDYVIDTAVIHRYWLTRNDSDELVQLNKREKKILQQNRQ